MHLHRQQPIRHPRPRRAQPCASTRWTPLAARLTATALLTWFTTGSATAISYQVLNHPDGGAIGSGKTVDQDGYVLRLDANGKKNTFNANTDDAFLTLNFTPGGTTATITGQVTHNESGTLTNQADSSDDVYQLSATFHGSVLLTDQTSHGHPGPWYGPNDPSTTFDDMFASLLADANDPNRSVEQSSSFSTDLARIYWSLNDLDITKVSGPGLGQTFPIATLSQWDEYPNNPALKQFFFQYRWRLPTSQYVGVEHDRIAAAGWLEQYEDSGQTGTNDWLFTLSPTTLPPVTPAIPEPVTGTLGAMGFGALAMALHRRRRVP